jgi:hypothetical protein
MTSNQVRFSIAEIGVSLECENRAHAMTLDAAHQNFTYNGEPDIRLQISFGMWPVAGQRKQIFHSSSWWALYENERNKFMSFYQTIPPFDENRRGVFAKDFLSGTIYTVDPVSYMNALSYPLEELIFINVLPNRRGVIIHSCGLATPEGGYLFVGASGAGKSTITKIFQQETTHKVLSDDRIIIREKDGQFWMHGTPWHGEVEVCENSAVPLKRIYFIKHFSENSAKRWGHMQSAMMLLARSFPPFWNKDGMEETTRLCGDIAERVPCFELGFIPDKNLLPFLSTTNGS